MDRKKEKEAEVFVDEHDELEPEDEETAETKAEEEPASGEETPGAQPKKRRSRRPRKASPPASALKFKASDEREEEEAVEELDLDSPASDNGKELRADIAVAATTVKRSMETMVKHWQSVQAITNSVSSQFEKLNAELLKQSEILHAVSKQNPPKPPAITKIALGVSALAIVFSLISFSFSQTVRQAWLSQSEAPAIATKEFPRSSHGPAPMLEPLRRFRGKK